MKKLLLTVCFSLLLSTIAHAQIYTNEQFNFQVKFPSGWSESIDYMLKNSLIEKYQLIKEDNEEFLGLIAISAIKSTNSLDKENFIDFTNEDEQKKFLPAIISEINNEFPNATINTAEFSTINGTPALIITYDIVFPDLTLRRTDGYLFFADNYITITLITDDLKGELYYSQFLQILDSCQTLSPTS